MKFIIECWYSSAAKWDAEFVDLWRAQLADPSLQCWTREESLQAHLIQLNSLALVFWCNAQGVVQLLKKVWGRTGELSEVSLSGPPLVDSPNDSGSVCSS